MRRPSPAEAGGHPASGDPIESGAASTGSTYTSPSRADLPWLAAALAVGGVVGGSYLLTHPYPAYGAGLFLQIAEQVAANGYRLPATVANYTANGVPLAYPPLMFYVSAALLDAGVGPVALTRYLPVAVTTLYLVPYYFLSLDLLDSRAEATLATMLLAVTPPTLQWHLSAGGLVRAPAFLFALTGIWVGVRLFESGSVRLLVPATLLFALTILTHPVYTVFFGVSYLLLYVAVDRSLRGLALGAAVAVGGIALAAPWWTQVVATHGVGVFTAAAGTHSGLFGGADRVAESFVYTLVVGPPVPAFFALAYAGAFYFVGTGRPLLPAWLLTSAMVIGKDRFQFVAGAMLTAALLCAAVRTTVRRRLPAESWRAATRVALAGVVVAGATVGALYGAGALSTVHAGSPAQPQFVDRADLSAMAWAAGHTAESADFVVLGDAAEWFPAFAERTILVGPWGVEWTSPARYATQLALYERISTCHAAACVTAALNSHGVHPEYLYVPKGHFTVRGTVHEGTSDLRRSLVRSDRYRLVYENEGACIFRVVDDAGERGQLTTTSRSASRPNSPTTAPATAVDGTAANGPSATTSPASSSAERTAATR